MLIQSGVRVEANEYDTYSRKSPFVVFIDNLLRGGWALWRNPFELNKCVTVWSETISSAGVDLLVHGAPAHRYISEQITEQKHFARTSQLQYFTYGGLPSQWCLWLHHPGEFWYLIEHPELSIPGAWIESEDRDHFDAYDADFVQ